MIKKVKLITTKVFSLLKKKHANFKFGKTCLSKCGCHSNVMLFILKSVTSK